MKMDKKDAIKQLANVQKEVDRLKKIIETPEIDLFSITKYSEVCKTLGIKELTLNFFNNDKEFAIHQLLNIERLFNEDWKIEWTNHSQKKHHPYFEFDTKGGGRFLGSCYGCYCFSGRVAYFETEQKSTYVGKTFIDIYKRIAINK